ncbi:potassium channel family protein [Flavobacterium aquidurense]|uniref:potassium channel family protein n=1 Tax=Flavobacterium aquidurense TaxID=362413 RepID=UPI0028642DFB|nr:potassium channel family protein [Flavobacterium aquidurense]MDR7371347.1 putative membrane protein [Flavobacterium aquidurense]
MTSIKDRFMFQFWMKESGLSGMLILLCIMHFILVPLLGSYSFFMVVLNIFWMLFLLAGVFSLKTDTKKIALITILPVLFIIFEWINFLVPGPVISCIDFVLTIATFLMVITLILRRVFESGPINGHRIIGSIVVYMLVANLWCILYLFIYDKIEGAFQMALPQFDCNSTSANFLYFSYITLTTTGYGEILPLHPVARSLVQMETLVGILYPVILIGNLVSNVGNEKPKQEKINN